MDNWDAKYQFVVSPFSPSADYDNLLGQSSLHSSFYKRDNIGTAYTDLIQVQQQYEDDYDEEFDTDTETETDTDEDEDTDEEDDDAGANLSALGNYFKSLIVQVIVI